MIGRAEETAVLVVSVAGSAILGHQLGSSRAAPGTSRARQLTVVDPYAAGGTWYKGNLQVASVRGVGKDLPKTLGAWYAAHGYAFLGISDMNTYTWPEEYGSPALPGVPTVGVTYPFADVLAIGIDHWLPAQTLQRAIDWIAADGGLPVLAAPLSPAKPQSLLAVMGLHSLYGLEVYDARLALGGAASADATELWDRLLSAGNRVFAVAGDDATGVNDPAIGGAWISVLASSDDSLSLLSSLLRAAGRLDAVAHQRRRVHRLDGCRVDDHCRGAARLQPALYRPRRPAVTSRQRQLGILSGHR